MRVLITAGGTTEAIDEVRGITNFSTGKLGSLLAEAYSKVPGVEVTYLCGRQSVRPSNPAIKTVEIGSTGDLLTHLNACFDQADYQVVVHSMAVSDYYVTGVASEEELLSVLAETRALPASEALSKAFRPNAARAKKMSSKSAKTYLQLEQTPKVIAVLRARQPAATIVGFKLLVDVPKADLLAVATTLLQKNACDYVLANDLQAIIGDQHRAYLLNAQGEYQTFETKQEIAQGMVEQTLKGRKLK